MSFNSFSQFWALRGLRTPNLEDARNQAEKAWNAGAEHGKPKVNGTDTFYLVGSLFEELFREIGAPEEEKLDWSAWFYTWIDPLLDSEKPKEKTEKLLEDSKTNFNNLATYVNSLEKQMDKCQLELNRLSAHTTEKLRELAQAKNTIKSLGNLVDIKEKKITSLKNILREALSALQMICDQEKHLIKPLIDKIENLEVN